MNNYRLNAQEFSASDVVKTNMIDYTLDVALKKLPSYVDGLKAVHRRTLWAAKDIQGTIPGTEFVGKVLKFHPVGDQSVIDAFTRASQSFTIGSPLINIDGNKSSYTAPDAGAIRYIKVGLSELAKDLFFNGINLKTIPMIPDEICYGLEPAYLIPKLPTTLLIAIMMIGVGTKSVIYPLQFGNVCDLVRRFIDHKSKNTFTPFDYSKCPHLFVPDIPVPCRIKNINELHSHYSRGDFSAGLFIETDVDIKQNKIIFHTVPYGQSFTKMTEFIKSEMNNKKSFLNDTLTDFHDGATDRGHIELTFKKSCNIFEIFNELKNMIHYSTTLTPIPNYSNKEGLPVSISPINLLEIWYNERRNSISGGISYDRSAIMKNIREKEVLIFVRDHNDQVTKIIKESNSKEDCIETLKKKFNLTTYQAMYIVSAGLNTLSKWTKQSHEEDVKRLYEKASLLTEQAKNLDDVIYKDAEYLQRKYLKPRVTKITEFKGYISVNNSHIVQWDSIDEAFQLMSDFPGCKVHTYLEKMNRRILISNSKTKWDSLSPSKITNGSKIIEGLDKPYTIGIVDTRPTGFEGDFNITDEHVEFYPVSRNFIGITLNGEIVNCKIDPILNTKVTVRNKANYRLLYAIPGCYNKVVLIRTNSVTPTNLTLDLIDSKNLGKIRIPSAGENNIIGFIPYDSNTPYIFNLPRYAFGNYNYLLIKNINKLIGNETSITVQMKRHEFRHDRIRDMISL